MNHNNFKPTDAELEVLKIFWELGPSTVREIHNELIKSKNSGYTTTLKIMQIMCEKGILKRKQVKNSHVYEPIQKEEDTKKYLLNKFVNAVFQGSTSKLVMQLLGNKKSSAEEIEEIRKMLDEVENKKNDA